MYQHPPYQFNSTAADKQKRQHGRMPASWAAAGALLGALALMFVVWRATSPQFTDRPLLVRVHPWNGAPAVLQEPTASAVQSQPSASMGPVEPSIPLVERPTNASSREQFLASLLFAQTNVTSLNPPRPNSTSGPSQLELRSRLVIGIVAGVHSGGANASAADVSQLHVVKTMFATFVPTARPGYTYRIYLAFDTVDPVFGQPAVREAVTAALRTAVAAEDAKRWHPAVYEHGSTIDASALVISLHWFRCDYTGKPAWAQNDAAMAAFKEGADYVLRTNDDTRLPASKGWETELIRDLRGRRPVPNLGVVGPASNQTNTAILTHDFVHKTHVLIHGFYYPRIFPTMYADDWITLVYSGFQHPPLMVKRHDLPVVHLVNPGRYSPALPSNITAIVQQEVDKGKQTIKAFTLKHFNITPTR